MRQILQHGSGLKFLVSAIVLMMAICLLSCPAWAIPDSALYNNNPVIDEPIVTDSNSCFVDPANKIDLSKMIIDFTLGDQTTTCEWAYASGMPTWMPVKKFVSEIGGSVCWKNDPGVVFFSAGNRTFAYHPRVKYLYIVQKGSSGTTWQKVYYAQPLKIVNGTSYLSSQILTHMGMTYTWDITHQKLDITQNANIYQTEYKAPTVDEAWSLIGADLKKSIPKSVTTFLGAKTTYFNPSLTNRTTNLRLATKALNGVVVSPGATFSFNKTVGPRTPARGYKKAIIFQAGSQVEGYGGGVCQISSTLYNAVLAARLQVVERHPHSLPVSYVPKGYDASVYYGSADFRFKNTTKGNVIIKTIMGSNYVKIELYSKT